MLTTAEAFHPVFDLWHSRFITATVRLRRLREANIEAELHVFEAMWHGFMAMRKASKPIKKPSISLKSTSSSK